MPDSHKKLYKEKLKRRGMMLVLAAPPGGGKTSISREIVKQVPSTAISVSATTRDMRPGEQDGVHYYFVSEDKFRDMIDQGELLEYAQVYNKSMYGTPKAPIEEALANGTDVIFDIDWQGHLKLKAMMPDDVVSIFILPPEFEDLEARLIDRGRDTKEDIDRRVKKAMDEISHYKEFQYIVINDEFDRAVEKVKAIITAERLNRLRLRGIDTFVSELKPKE